MFHPFAGISGLELGAVAFIGIGSACYFTKKSKAYHLDPKGVPNTFEPLLAKYIRLAEFVIGLASASIVLLVGSSALHGQSGHLPWTYASPLLLLCWCILFGIGFMAWLILSYEEYQHGNPHTRERYALSEALGFSSITCFVVGYAWLIIAVTR